MHNNVNSVPAHLTQVAISVLFACLLVFKRPTAVRTQPLRRSSYTMNRAQSKFVIPLAPHSSSKSSNVKGGLANLIKIRESALDEQ